MLPASHSLSPCALLHRRDGATEYSVFVSFEDNACCLRVVTGLGRPNCAVTQLSPSLTQKHCIPRAHGRPVSPCAPPSSFAEGEAGCGAGVRSLQSQSLQVERGEGPKGSELGIREEGRRKDLVIHSPAAASVGNNEERFSPSVGQCVSVLRGGRPYEQASNTDPSRMFGVLMTSSNVVT